MNVCLSVRGLSSFPEDSRAYQSVAGSVGSSAPQGVSLRGRRHCGSLEHDRSEALGCLDFWQIGASH